MDSIRKVTKTQCKKEAKMQNSERDLMSFFYAYASKRQKKEGFEANAST